MTSISRSGVRATPKARHGRGSRSHHHSRCRDKARRSTLGFAREDDEGENVSSKVSQYVVDVVSTSVDAFRQRYLRPKRCLTCLGTGYVVCDTCKGRGKTGGLLTGSKGVCCSTCEGEGCTKCSACNATGIANNWLFQPAKDPGWGPRGEL